MDLENKQRISLYLDKDLVKKADKFLKDYGFKSRNEFYSYAVENLIADEMLKDNSNVISDKLSKAIAECSEDNAKAISKPFPKIKVISIRQLLQFISHIILIQL